MPLGAREILLIIRADDQASRVLSQVGNTLGTAHRAQLGQIAEQRTAVTGLYGHQLTTAKSAHSQLQAGNAFEHAENLRNLSRERLAIESHYGSLAEKYKTNTKFNVSLNEFLRDEELRGLDARGLNLHSHYAKVQKFSKEASVAEIANITKNKEAELAALAERAGAIQAHQQKMANLSSVGAGTAKVGAVLAGTGVIGLGLLGKAAKEAQDYDQAARLTTTQINQVGVKLNDVKDIAQRVGKEIPVPFKQLQPALYDIFSSITTNTQDAEVLLRNFAKAGAASLTDVSTVARSTFALMNNYKKGPNDIGNILDVQFKTVQQGIGTYADMAATIGQLSQSAELSGQSMEGMAAGLALASRVTNGFAEGSTELKNVFNALGKTGVQDKLKAMGVEVLDGKGNFRELKDIMNDLNAAFTRGGHAASGVGKAAKEGAKLTKEALASALVEASNMHNEELRKIQISGIAVKQKYADIIARSGGASKEVIANLKKQEADELRSLDLRKIQENASYADNVTNAKNAAFKKLEAFKATVPAGETGKPLSEAERAAAIDNIFKTGNAASQNTKRLIGSMTGDIKGYTEVFNEIAGNAAGALDTAANKMHGPAEKAQAFKNRMEEVRREIGDRLLPVKEKLIDSLNKLMDKWDKLSPKTKDTIVKFAAIGAVVLTVVGTVLLIAGAVAMAVAALGGFAAVGIALAAIAATLATVYSIFTLIKEFGPALANAFGAVERFFKALWHGAQDAWDAVWKFFKDLPGKIGEAFKDAKNWLKDKGKDIINGLKNGITTAWDDTLRFFKELPGKILGALGNAATFLKEHGRKMIMGMADGIGFAIGNVIGFFIMLPFRIFDALKDANTWLVDKGKDLIQGLWEGIQAVWDKVLTFFKELPRHAFNAMGNVLSFLFGTGKDLMQGLWNGIQHVWDQILNFFKELPRKVLDAIGDIYKFLFEKGKALIQGLWDGAQNVWDGFIGAVKRIPRTIMDAVGDLGSLLLEAGKNLIKGLIRGIENQVPGLKGTLQWVTDHLPDWKGPMDKDKRILVDNGIAVMGGFMHGIESQRAVLARQLGGMTSSLPSMVGGPLGAARGQSSAVGSGAVVIAEGALQMTINGNVDKSVMPDLERMMDEKLRDLANQLARRR